MDLEEWELLPDDGFLEIHDDGGKKIFSRKYATDPNVFKTNYFVCPSPKSKKFSDPREIPRPPKQIVRVPIQLEPPPGAVDREAKEDIGDQKVEAPNMVGFGAEKTDQDTISHVSFKKIVRENEFVDMKLDSPKSSSRAPLPQIDVGAFQFEKGRSEVHRGEAMDSKMKIDLKNEEKEVKDDAEDEVDDGGLNIWKWSSTGIGAICSFGVAAATFCLIVFGTHQKNKREQNQKLRVQIYTDDKRIKQVVAQHAAKLNEAMSAVRGVPVPLTRAHITVGGYYDGL